MQVTNSAMKCLLQYDWPGNVRELENCVERAVALGDRRTIDIGDLPPTIASASPTHETSSLGSSAGLSSNDLEDIERATIERVFEQVNGDKVMAGKMLGISRATLYRKQTRYNMAVDTTCLQGVRRCNRPVLGETMCQSETLSPETGINPKRKQTLSCCQITS